MHVLILGARAPACLEWARAFHAAGWQVSVADSLVWPLTRSSHAINSYIRLPEPRNNPATWVDTLQHLIDERNIDLILPTCEEVFYLSHGLPQLSSRCRVMTMDIVTMHSLHHKYLFSEMTTDWPVTAPETWLLETPESVAQFTPIADELVFKPVYSRFASHTKIQPSPKKLSQIQPTKEQPWVAQRFVAGREHCSYSLLTNGKLTAHACYHPLYRVGSGSGIFFESANPPQVRAFVERFGSETGYTGQVAFDFIEAHNGQFYVLECNPRATSGIHLFDDQPLELVAALLGEGENGILLPSTTPRMVALAMLLFLAPRHALNLKFWRDFRSARDVITRPDDYHLLPAQIPSLLEIVGRALFLRRGLLAATTADIEWNGQPLEGDSQ